MRQCQQNIGLKHELQHVRQTQSELKLDNEELIKWRDEVKSKAIAMRTTEHKNDSLRAQLRQLDSSHSQANEEINRLTIDNRSTQQELKRLHTETIAATKENVILTSRIESEQHRNASLQTSLANERRVKRNLEDRARVLEEASERDQNKLSQAESKLDQFKAENGTLSAQLMDAKQENRKLTHLLQERPATPKSDSAKHKRHDKPDTFKRPTIIPSHENLPNAARSAVKLSGSDTKIRSRVDHSAVVKLPDLADSLSDSHKSETQIDSSSDSSVTSSRVSKKRSAKHRSPEKATRKQPKSAW